MLRVGHGHPLSLSLADQRCNAVVANGLGSRLRLQNFANVYNWAQCSAQSRSATGGIPFSPDRWLFAHDQSGFANAQACSTDNEIAANGLSTGRFGILGT